MTQPVGRVPLRILPPLSPPPAASTEGGAREDLNKTGVRRRV